MGCLVPERPPRAECQPRFSTKDPQEDHSVGGSRDPPCCPAAAEKGKFHTPFSGIGSAVTLIPQFAQPLPSTPLHRSSRPRGLQGVCGRVRHPFFSSETPGESGAYQPLPSSATLLLAGNLLPKTPLFHPHVPSARGGRVPTLSNSEVGFFRTAQPRGSTSSPASAHPFPFHRPAIESPGPGPPRLLGASGWKGQW